MTTLLQAVLGGTPFQTSTGRATVLGRFGATKDRSDDALLLNVESNDPGRPSYRAFTTLPVLADALEAKRWRLIASGTDDTSRVLRART